MRFLLYLGLLVGTFFMGSCNDFDLDTLTGKERLAGVVDGKKMSCCSVWDRARK